MASELVRKIELLLFYEGGTMGKKALRAALGCEEGEFVQALLLLKDVLQTAGKERGVVLYESATDVSLRAHPDLSVFLTEYEKKNLAENVGSAAIEVLAVLLYRGPSSQAEVDSIRGVNSAMSLRILRTRGLITKDEIEGSAKGAARYSLTSEALAHLGVTNEGGVEGRADIQKKLAEFEERLAQDQK